MRGSCAPRVECGAQSSNKSNKSSSASSPAATRTRDVRASGVTRAATSSCSPTRARPGTFVPVVTRGACCCTASGSSENVLAPVAGEGPCLPSWRTVSTSSYCPSSCARSSHRQRAWLGELRRIAARLLTDAYTAAALRTAPAWSCSCRPSGTWPTSKHACMCSPPMGCSAPMARSSRVRRCPKRSLAEGFRRAALRVPGEGADDHGRAAREDARLVLLRRVFCAQPGARWGRGPGWPHETRRLHDPRA